MRFPYLAPGFSTTDPYWPSLVFPGSLKGAADEAIKKFEKENATEGSAKKVTIEKITIEKTSVYFKLSIEIVQR